MIKSSKYKFCKLPGSYSQCMYTYFLPGVIGVLGNGEERSIILAYMRPARDKVISTP